MVSPYLTPHTPHRGEEHCHLLRAVRELLGGDGCREASNPGRFLGWRRWGASSLQDALEYGPLGRSGSGGVQGLGV